MLGKMRGRGWDSKMTKIYLKDSRHHKDIYAVEKNEGMSWIRTSEDEKGIFYVLDGKLDKKKLPKYPGIREIGYLSE